MDDDVSMLRGKHQIVVGGQWVQNQLNISNAYESNGTLTFDGRYGLNGRNGGLQRYGQLQWHGHDSPASPVIHLQPLANYTWSKCLNIVDAQGDYAGTNVQNPYNPGLDYGPCGSDYRNVGNIVLTTRSQFSFSSRLASALLNNWEFAPLVHIVSGEAFNVTSGQDNSFTDVGNDRPNRIPGVPLYLHQTIRSLPGAANRQYLNAAAFAQVCPTGATPLTCAAYGTYGNISRNAFRGTTSYQFDAQVSRTFPIYERLNTTLRLEAFNVLNHPNFNPPTSSATSQTAPLTSSTFGQISSQANQARVFQGSIKLNF